MFNKRIITSHVHQAVAFLVVVNGLYYVLQSLIYFIDLPALRDTLDVVQQVNIIRHETFSASFSILFGLMTIFVGIGLYKRSRIAWLWTVIFLFLLLGINFMSNSYDKMFYVSLVLLVVLIISKSEFNRSIGILSSGKSIAIVSILFAMAYGVIGSYLLRDEFSGIHSLGDAIYFTVVTYSTVGYGDVTPQTALAKLFTSSMILIGLSSFATAVALYLGPFLEKRMKEIFSVFSKLDHVRGHYIICGHNAISEFLVHTFNDEGVDCVIIDPKLDLSHVQDSKHVTYIKGDPTDSSVFKSCSISHSIGVLSTINNDADNILIALTVSNIMEQKSVKNFQIIVSINKQENIANAKRVGATEVMTPAKVYSDTILSKVHKSKV
ncbi:MAG: voltage-gated potassium channel [Francisellaceae bacterium]|jgi:voltage-gated potassium channel